MIKFNAFGLLLAASIYVPVALAADASVEISSPAAGATLKAGSPIPVTYNVVPGSKGDHTHIYSKWRPKRSTDETSGYSYAGGFGRWQT